MIERRTGPETNSAPDPGYNTIFERLVDDASGQQGSLGGIIAYGIYKVAKREWAADIRQRTGSGPTEDQLRDYIRTWTPSRLDGLRNEATSVLASYASEVIKEAEPGIREDALKGTASRAIFYSIVANFIYTLVLLLVVLLLAWNGVDILGLMQKARPGS